MNYFRIGLTLGLTYDMLWRNEERPRLEMLLAARVNNYKTLPSEEFLLKIIGKTVITHVEGMLKYKEFIQEYRGSVDMSHWCVADSMKKTVEYTSAFELALLCLSTLIASVDKIDYDYEINDPNSETFPMAVKLFYTETGRAVSSMEGDVLLNEFLFQLGLTAEDLVRAADGSEDISAWDMRLVTFKALCTLWMQTTEGEPLENIDMFRNFFSKSVVKTPNSYTIKALISLFLPERMYEYGGNKLGWVRDKMLWNWPVIHEAIVNEWGASRGFSMSKNEEEEQEEEDKPVMTNSTQMLAEAIKLGSKRRKFASDGSTFSISFSLDNDEFLVNILTRNKYIVVSHVDEIRKYEIHE